MRKVIWILVVLVGFLILSGFGASGLVFAEENGVRGSWAIFESECGSAVFKISFTKNGSFYSGCEDQDFIEEKNAGQDRIFIPGEDTLKTIYEQGTYTVSGDSIIIHIAESDIADRIGITFIVNFSRAGDSITFTNARELTFGYVDEKQVTLYDLDYYEENEPFMGWWEIYDPNEIENSPLFGIRLDRCGSFYSFCQVYGFIEERGTYIVSGDSITITITESHLPDRVGVRFTVRFLINEPMIVFTNAPMLTAGWTNEETITLTRALTAIRPSTWGKIKSSHR